jgi:hypothetical protein
MEVTRPGAHLDHMVRQTRMHQAQLSSMADMKANILLTMASVVITLSVRYLAEPHLKWATIILIFFCMLTVGLATYAVMPKISLSLKRDLAPDLNRPDFNLLFFGDFVRLNYEDFEAAMEGVMNDPSRTYQVQLQDVFIHGTFLAKRKYRFLRVAYTTFIVGAFSAAIVGVLSGALG